MTTPRPLPLKLLLVGVNSCDYFVPSAVETKEGKNRVKHEETGFVICSFQQIFQRPVAEEAIKNQEVIYLNSVLNISFLSL